TDGLSFTGFGIAGEGAGVGIDWPRGASEAAITYSCNGVTIPALSTTNEDNLPSPPAECDQVTGFTVTFTGAIVQGAKATIPFGVVTAAAQDSEVVTRSNTIEVTGKLATITD